MPRRSGRDDPDGMRIATVSRLLGVPVPTIRSWERRYEFPAPPRTDGLHRRYGDVEFEQLRALRDLVTKGHRHEMRWRWYGTSWWAGPGMRPFRAGR